MGFNDAMVGYKKLKNENKESLEQIFDRIKDVPFSMGEPKIGEVAKKRVITWEPIGRFTVYIAVSDKKIEVMRSIVQNIGKNLLKELAATAVSDASAMDTSKADRAVDEVYEVLCNVLSAPAGSGATGQTVVNGAAKTAEIKYYMRQKIVSIKDRYSICLEDETPVYWVEGNLVSLNYKILDATEAECLQIKKKLVSIMPEYTIVQGNSAIGTLKKKIKLTRPEVSGSINGKPITILGDLNGLSFSIKAGDSVIGAVDTVRLTWGDCYSIEVMDTAWKDIVVAIAIVVDNVISSAR